MLYENLETLNFLNMFLMETCAPHTLPVASTLRTSTASTSKIENAKPRCSKKPRIESSFGPDFVTIFLTENSNRNYLDGLNENFL